MQSFYHKFTYFLRSDLRKPNIHIIIRDNIMQNNETVSRYQKPVSETDILDNVRNDTPLITITTEKDKPMHSTHI